MFRDTNHQWVQELLEQKLSNCVKTYNQKTDGAKINHLFFDYKKGILYFSYRRKTVK